MRNTAAVLSVLISAVTEPANVRRQDAVPLRPDRFRIRTGWAGTSYGEPEGVPALLPKTVEGVIKV